MKTRIFTATLALASIFAIASCNKDQKDTDKTPIVTPAEAVAGIYDGTLSLEVLGSIVGTESVSLTLTATGDDTVTITISSFEAMGSQLGEIAIQSVSVTENSGQYTLSEDSFSVQGVTFGESSVTVTGSAEGTSDADGNLDVDFIFNFGAMPMPVYATFTADN